MGNKKIIFIFAMIFILMINGENLFAAESADKEVKARDEESVIHSIVDGGKNNKETTEQSDSIYKKTIHVAWYEKKGYFEKDAEGNLYGFGMDYLDVISEYTGWQYEFMQGTRAQCIRYLETGLADIMSPVGVDSEFENAKVAREVIGEDYGYIYKAANNYYLNFEDADTFADVTLGIEEQSGLLDSLQRYCEEKGIYFYDVITYETLDDMRLALSNGKIDAFVTDSYVKLDNLKVIGQFSNNRVTFASSKDYVLENLNYALEHIKLDNPNLSNELKEKHFGEGSQNSLEYTQDEKEFLSTHHNYKVVLSGNQYPLSYLGNNEKDEKEYRGITEDILDKVENQTGIKFDVIYVDSYAQAEKILYGNQADILGGIVLNSQKAGVMNALSQSQQGEHIKYTNAFYNVTLAFVGNRDTNLEDVTLIAIPAYLESGVDTLLEDYPLYDFIVYESDDECFDAVLNKEVDAAIQPELKINEITMYEKYKSLQNLKYVQGSYVAVFGVNNDNALLVSILNKAIRSISDASIASIENSNMQHVTYTMSAKDFIVIYKWYIIAVGAVILIVFVSVSLYLKYKREVADKEKAYRDKVANVSSIEKFRIDAEPILNSPQKTEYYLIVVDIDKFKVINTLYGYEKGDETIAYVAGVLKSGLKNDDCITRSTADKFDILKRANNDDEIAAYLEDVFDQINERLLQKKTNYRMLLKAGIYQIGAEDDNISSIIDKASMAKKTD